MPYKPSERLCIRLLAFMEHHDLNQGEMAELLNDTPYGTFRHWVRDEALPPACLVTLMDVMERFPDVRTFLGIMEPKQEAPEPWRQ
jgi:hypothetical protein